MNIGIQRELRPGMALSADYLRNIQTHYLLGIDENHTGDIRYFNKAAALQAISATNQSFNCGSGTDFNSIQCAISAGAQKTDYANNGLTSSADFGAVCSFPSVNSPGNYGCAFPGINPNAPPRPFEKVHRTLGIQRATSETHPKRGVPKSSGACAELSDRVRPVPVRECGQQQSKRAGWTRPEHRAPCA